MKILEPGHPRAHLSGQLIWGLAWVGVTAVGLYLTPSQRGHGTHEQLGLPPCPSVLLSQRPCPGCGLTTSWTAVLHGDFQHAFQAHALGPILYILFTLTAWLSLYGWVRKARVVSESRPASWTMGVVALVFFAYGITRFATASHYDDRFNLASLPASR
ncbi:MAG: DUF2752 domain-containing protein [Fimbriimonas sp.]